MFGIGFTELLLISIVAILFLGPDKLPGALVEMGKFIKTVKNTVAQAKNSFEEEMKIADLKEEALNYKKQLTDATDELKNFKNISFDDFDDISYNNEISKESPQAMASKAKIKDPYAQAPTKAKESIQKEVLARQVEPKNDSVTFKKKQKITTVSTQAIKTKEEKNNDNKDTV